MNIYLLLVNFSTDVKNAFYLAKVPKRNLIKLIQRDFSTSFDANRFEINSI